MAFVLNALSGNDAAVELGNYLDRSLKTTTAESKVKQEIIAGHISAAVSFLVSESSQLWTPNAATDKGTY
jgi:hypothetical protein